MVLFFENADGDPQLKNWSSGVHWLLEDSLREVRSLQLRPLEATNLVYRKLALQPGDPIGAVEARRFGEWLQAHRVISGSFRREGSRWEWNVRVHTVASADLPVELSASGPEVLALRDELVEKILGAMGVTPPEEERARRLRRPTASAGALELFVKAPLPAEAPEQLSQAQLLLRQAIQLAPEFSAARAVLAMTLVQQGKSSEAEEEVRAALKLEPQGHVGVRVLGGLLLAQGRLEEAERFLSEVARLRPDDAAVQEFLGRLYFDTKRLELAAASFRRVVQLNPVHVAAFVQLARINVYLRQREQAGKAVADAESLEPKDPELLQAIGWIHEMLADVPRAVEFYERVAAAMWDSGAKKEAIQAVEAKTEELRQSLSPRSNRAEKPKVYTPEELAAALRERLTPEELALAVNPIERNAAMEVWGRELAKGASTQIERAKAIFDGLKRRIQLEGGWTKRTAIEVFESWSRPEEVFNCQELAKLYITLARAAGLEAFYVHVERDDSGKVVDHACAAVFVDGKALLVDLAYRWFGVRHAKFIILDDLQAVAHQLLQGSGGEGGVERCRAAEKLHQDSPWGKCRLSGALIAAGKTEEALRVLDWVEQNDPGRWEVEDQRGQLAELAGNAEEAEKHFRKAVELHPEAPQLRVRLASVLSQQGRLIEAREEIRASLRFETNKELADGARRALALLNEKLAQLSTPLVSRILTAQELAKGEAELGAHADVSRFEIVGCKTYDPKAVIQALNLRPAALSHLHPRAKLDDALKYIEREVLKGFLAGGFPRAEVKAAIEGDRLLIRVSEGERFPAGEIVVDGNSSLSSAEIIKVLSTPPEGEERATIFWDVSGPARFGPMITQRAEEEVRGAYGRSGFREAQVEARVNETSDGKARLEIHVVREGPKYKIGEITFLGPHTDDAKELEKKLSLSEGMAADSKLCDVVTAQLEALGRYHEFRARELPGARLGEVDLEVYLRQADFVPPLTEPVSEVQQVLQKGLAWLNQPKDWKVGHALAASIGEGMGPVSGEGKVEIVLEREGFSYKARWSLGSVIPVSLVHLVIRGRSGTIVLPFLGMGSRFQASPGIAYVMDFALRLMPPGSGNTWNSIWRLGVSTASEGPGFRLNFSVPPIAIAYIMKESLELKLEEKVLHVALRQEGKSLPLANIDRESGEVKFEGSYKTEAADLKFHSGAGLLESSQREVLDLLSTKPTEEIPLPVLAARAISKVGALAAPRILGDDRELTFALSIVVQRLFRDDGYVVRTLEGSQGTEARKPDRPPEDFWIPSAQEEFAAWGANPFAFFGAAAAIYVAPRFPLDSWPRTLLAEAGCLLNGQPRYTQREIFRVLSSPEVGPIGHWTFAEVHRIANMDVLSRRFAARALSLCSVDGFRRELDLLEKIAPGILADLGLGLKTADASKAQGLFEGASPADPHAESEIRTLWEGRDSRDPRELGEGLLCFVWRRAVESRLRSRIVSAWPDLAPAAPASAIRDEEVELAKDPTRLREHYVERGNALEKEGKLKEAAQHYRWALQLNAADHRLHEDLGNVLMQLKEYDEAAMELISALELMKTCPRARALTRHAILAFIQDRERRDLERAKVYARRVLMETGETDAGMAPLLALAEAEADALGGRPEEALRRLEDAARAFGAAEVLEETIRKIRTSALPDLLTFSSIDAAIEQPVSLMAPGVEWKYFRGLGEPSQGLEWTREDFDDKAWGAGEGPLGYGEEGIKTILEGMRGSYTTLYCRRRFDFLDPSEYAELRLSVRADDGFVAYLNGEEIARSNAGAPGERLSFDAVAGSTVKEPVAPWVVAIEPRRLRKGGNLLAVQGLNSSLRESSDFLLEVTLDGVLRGGGALDRSRFDEFRKAARGETAARRLDYLEARLLQRAGKDREAAEILQRLRDQDPAAPELR